MSSDTNDPGDEQAILPFDDGSTGRLIRSQWHDGKWYFSVVDVVAVLTDSDTPRQYWGMLKKRLQDEGAREPLTNCLPLKMRALDGKMRQTDAATAETMLRIVQSVPSPKAEPIKQWLAWEGAKSLDEKANELPEHQKRLLLRGEIAEKNRDLAGTVASAGVITTRDFAIFQDFGYMGLYNGEKARDIGTRKGLAKSQRLLDYMGSEELAANWFRITQAEAKIRREAIDNKLEANAAHFTVGKKVRDTIADLGGTMPEELPTPEQSIQQIERAEQQRIAAEHQPRLFPTDK